MNDLYMLLYTSLLAPDASPTGISDIVRRSRINNRRLDITGLLVFDGMAFCQYLEGTAANVRALMQNILTDTRHIDVQIRSEGHIAPPRRFKEWSMAYGLYTMESLDSVFSGVTGSAVVQRFENLLPLIDREPCV